LQEGANCTVNKGLSCPYLEVGLQELPSTLRGGAGTPLHLASYSCPSVRD